MVSAPVKAMAQRMYRSVLIQFFILIWQRFKMLNKINICKKLVPR